LEQKEITINNLKGKLEGLSQEQEVLTQAFNNICEDKKELESSNTQLQKLNDSLEFNNSKLVEDTKGLHDLKQVNNKLLNENETIKVLLASQQADNIDLKNNLKDKDFTISGLNKEVEELKQDKLKALDQLKENHNSQLEQLKDKASLVMETALLNLKKVQQDQLSQEQSKHNTMIETYQAKYKALLEELEQERSIPKAKANK
jgi:DNA repair ATPase RecN